MTQDISEAAAKKALSRDATGTTACVMAIRSLLGNDWLLWEPATLWLDLARQGVDISVGNRGQIMAARALITTSRFWYDANVFEKTCIAFNNEEIQPDSLEGSPVMYLAWACWEAEHIVKTYGDPQETWFDREPVCYAAVQLFREGFAVAPHILNWADTALLKHYPKEHKTLRTTVNKAWAAAPSSDKLKDAAFPETAEGVQLARLAAVQLYLDTRKASLLADIATLTA